MTLEGTLQTIVDAMADSLANTGQRFDSLDDRLGSVDLRLGTVDARLDDITKIHGSLQTELAAVRKYTDHWLSFSYPTDVEGISPGLAEALNFASGHRGYASQNDLWFNPALSLQYSESSVALHNVNERIVETTFVLAEAVARTPQGGTILDLGCGESLIAYQLASFGFDVVGVDLNEYPLEHPNLKTIASSLESIDDEDLSHFDTIVCLSAIEHFGLGAYGEDPHEGRADIEALERLAALSGPNTSLILTTPFGKPSVSGFQRVYDSAGLEDLLAAWDIAEHRVAKQSGINWTIGSDTKTSSNTHSVALVVASPKK